MLRLGPCGFTLATAVCLCLSIVGAGHGAPANTITVSDISGTSQVARTVSIARPFRQGEIRAFVQAAIDGQPVPTQSDVKNRWPDGSLRFAVITFVIPRLPGYGAVEVAFGESRAAPAGGLTQAEMLASAFDFDAAVDMTADGVGRTVSARRMLAAGHWQYWLRGPLVTAVIIEDRSTARRYDQDFGDGSRALHPIFEAWFFPRDHSVDVGYTIENTWASSDPGKSMRDVEYSLVLRSGRTAPRVEFSHRAFRHISRTRWHKRFVIGRPSATVRIDHNLGYLVSTRAIPSYDTGLRIEEALVAAKHEGWLKAPRTLDGDDRGIGSYAKALGSGGASDWIGLLSTWDTLYLLTMDDRMREMSLGNADLAGRIPWHYREADRGAGTGRYFDAALAGSVDTHGRVVSVNARRTVSLWDLDAGCGERYAADRIRREAIGDHGWDTRRDHMPDLGYLAYLLTGRFYYLEELQYQAAFIVAHKVGCYSRTADEAYHRQGDRGYLHDTQIRGDAWGFRTLLYAAAQSPDGTPEKAYFEDKVRNNIAAWEGAHDVPLSDPSRQADWTWAHTYRRDARGPSPLGIWQDRPDAVQPPLHTDRRLKTATAPWEENFLVAALGMARNLGYPTDGLLRFLAGPRLNLLLNPAANRFLIGEYRWPGKLAGSGDWIQDYRTFGLQFVNPPTQWLPAGTTDHSFGLIALAAVSYLTPYTVGGYRGRAAWTKFRLEQPGQDRFVSDSPKWAIVPVDEGASPAPRRIDR